MNKKGLILVISTAIISGFSVFINKYGVSVMNSSIFTFLKNASVAMILTGVIFAFRNYGDLRKLKKGKWFLLAIIGLVGGSAPFVLFFKGLALTGAAQGSFIQKTMFVFVVVLAWVFLKEKISKSFLIGALFLLAGNLFILKGLKITFGTGDLLILLATILWAAENVISKFVLRDISANIVAWGRMFFGSLFILSFLALTGQLSAISSLNVMQIGWIAITSILLFGYVATWYNGLRVLPVSTATTILLFGSPITTLLVILAGGQINIKESLSVLLIVFGLTLIIGFDFIWGRVKVFKKHVWA